ncbi:MAG: hypothetical protein H6R05_1430 [Burkholderiaceae bacterium]|nr:hypothetical protein [Burkholderiaceae bacterium]
MKHSKQLFTHYMTLWARLLQQSAGQADPATYLLTHDARTPLFYLQGMTRVLMHEHNPKKMRRLNEWFKKMEDALGAMDYYTNILKDFKSNRKIPQTIKHDLIEKLKSATANLNTLLVELGWLGENANRVQKVHQYNQEMDWLGQKNVLLALKNRYQSDIRSIARHMKRPIEEIERDVHELRRDVRWLSIYPQAFKGFVNMQTVESIPESLLKYATPETIDSPYNQLAHVANINKVLYLNTHAYYAMSWLIAQLGVLKDSGLRLLTLAELLQTHQKLSKAQALKNAQTMLGTTQPSVEDLLNTARGLIVQVQNDKVFSQLLLSKNTPVIKITQVIKATPTNKPSPTTRTTPATPASPKTRATPIIKASTTTRATVVTKVPATKTRTAPAAKAPTATTTRTTTRATPTNKARTTTTRKTSATQVVKKTTKPTQS